MGSLAWVAALLVASACTVEDDDDTISAERACADLVPATCNKDAQLGCQLAAGDCVTELTPTCEQNLSGGADRSKTDDCVDEINAAPDCAQLQTAMACN